MEKEMLKVRPMGGRHDPLQYALAAAAIWGAVGFGLWAQAHPAAATNPVLLALQPLNTACNPS
jgi:uncharacterized membrane protein